MKGFLALATLVVAMGSVVGGVISVLIPKISSGVCVGVFVALFVSTVGAMHTPALELTPSQALFGNNANQEKAATISAVFVVSTSLGVVVMQKYEVLYVSWSLSPYLLDGLSTLAAYLLGD